MPTTSQNLRRSDLIALVVFCVLVIATGAVTIMMTLGKVTVAITPKTSAAPLSASMALVWSADGSAPSVSSPLTIVATRLEDDHETLSKTFTVPAGTLAPAKASGTVTIFNDGAAPQALAAQTRLEYADGQIFRIQERVSVPAHGSVDTVAVADAEGKQGEVAPGDWIIPGLRAANQKVVYGKNTTAMTGGEAAQQEVTQTLVDQAKEQMAAELVEAAKTAADTSANAALVAVANPTVTVAPEVGTAATSYTVTLVADLQILTVSKTTLADFATAALAAADDPASSYTLIRTDDDTTAKGNIASAGLVFQGIDADSLSPTLLSVDDVARSAAGTLTFTANFAPQTIDAGALRHQLAGKSESEALELLRSNPAVADASITFAKFFPRVMPSLPSLITVKVKP